MNPPPSTALKEAAPPITERAERPLLSVATLWRRFLTMLVVLFLGLMTLMTVTAREQIIDSNERKADLLIHSVKHPAQISIEFLDKSFSDLIVQGLVEGGTFYLAEIHDDFDRLQSKAERPVVSSPVLEAIAGLARLPLTRVGELQLPTSSGETGLLRYGIDQTSQIKHELRELAYVVGFFVVFTVVLAGIGHVYVRQRIEKGIDSLIQWVGRAEHRQIPALPDASDLGLREVNYLGETLHEAFTNLRESQSEVSRFERRLLNQLEIVNRVLDLTNQSVTLADASGKIRFSNSEQHPSKIIRAALAAASFDLASTRQALERAGAEVSVIFKNPKPDDTNRLMYSLEISEPEGSYWLVQSVGLAGGYTSLVTSDITQMRQFEDRSNHAKKMEAVGKVSSGVAHEFNNMLSIITGSLELVVGDQSVEGDARENTQIGLRACERARSIVSELVSLSSKSPANEELIDLSDWSENVAGLISSVTGPRIELKIESTSEGSIFADIGLLDAAVINMVANARDAIEGDGLVIIRTSDATAAQVAKCMNVPTGDYVMLEVTDSGSGMSAEALEKVFDPFFSTKERGRGIGLGMATVYSFVRNAGGHIRAASKPGEGTTFTLLFPKADTARAARQATPEPQDFDLGGKRIAVVEDETAILRILSTFLRSEGCEVHGFTTLAAAREFFADADKGGEIDLLLCDLNLTDGNGLRLCDDVAESHPAITRIIMTGDVSHIGEDAANKHGVLQKPFRLKALRERLRVAVEGQGVV